MSASVPPPRTDSQPPPGSSQRWPGSQHRAPDEPPWPSWTAPAAVALGFVVGIFASIVVGIFAQIGGSSLTHPTPAVSLTADLLFDLSFVGAAVYFASLHGRPRPSDFGFRRVTLGKAIVGLLAAGVGYYVVTAVYASVVKL